MTVVLLPGKGPIEPAAEIGPAAEVVELLERLLGEAKEGKIRAIATGIVREKGVVANAYAYGKDEGTCNHMVAAIAYLQWRFMTDQTQ
jgi:hypothetical protein